MLFDIFIVCDIWTKINFFNCLPEQQSLFTVCSGILSYKTPSCKQEDGSHPLILESLARQLA